MLWFVAPDMLSSFAKALSDLVSSLRYTNKFLLLVDDDDDDAVCCDK